MTDRSQAEQHAAVAQIHVKRRFSIVWVVPLVALVIGGWLAFKAIDEKGPTITISFVNAEGLEAGKTKIKYRNVDVGQVTQIMLSKDLSKIVVTAQMVKGSEAYLTDQTKIWVVRPRIQGGSISGLGTVLSGAYIGIDGDSTGTPTRTFTGLEVAPVVTYGQPGRTFKLSADTLGSIDIGAPVYYRQIQVGQVVSYNFAKDEKALEIQVFITEPHYKRITENTKFWNASGINVSLNAQGLKVDTQSVVSILTGGIAFDLPNDTPPGNEAKENAKFYLYANHDSINEVKYTIRNYWLLMFDESVSGLSVGAPVELYGIKVGEVVNLQLEFDFEKKKFQVPVGIGIEPERIRTINKKETPKDAQHDPLALAKELVEQHGLRAQLKSGNLLTGQLKVNLVFVPDAPKALVVQKEGYSVVPTIPGAFEQLQEGLTKIIANLGKVRFDQIGPELQQVLKETRSTLKDFGGLAGKLDKETVPQVQTSIAELQKTLVELQRTIGENSPMQYNVQRTLEELTRTLRTFRELADTLEKRPQALIFGKDKNSKEHLPQGKENP